jgi:hypothetical protein
MFQVLSGAFIYAPSVLACPSMNLRFSSSGATVHIQHSINPPVTGSNWRNHGVSWAGADESLAAVSSDVSGRIGGSGIWMRAKASPMLLPASGQLTPSINGTVVRRLSVELYSGLTRSRIRMAYSILQDKSLLATEFGIGFSGKEWKTSHSAPNIYIGL